MPAWCVTDDHLVIATGPQRVKEALLQIERGRDGSLLTNDRFTASLTKMPKGACFVGYVNDRQLVDVIYPVLPPAWQLLCSWARSEGVPLDPAWLPTRRAFMEHMGDSTSVVVNRDDGIYSETRSFFPGGSLGMVVGQMGIQMGQLMWMMPDEAVRKDAVPADGADVEWAEEPDEVKAVELDPPPAPREAPEQP
jgi:hypothetical protein